MDSMQTMPFIKLVASPIVVVGDKASMLIAVNEDTGNINTYPLFLPYNGNTEDFRLDYYNKLLQLSKAGILPSVHQTDYMHSPGDIETIYTSRELAEILNEAMRQFADRVILDTKLLDQGYAKNALPMGRILYQKETRSIAVTFVLSVTMNIVITVIFLIWLIYRSI